MDKWHDIVDDEVLDWCDKQMSDDEQTELSELLAKSRENQLTTEDALRLEILMNVYRDGLVHKAKAINIAVQRGLRPRLN